MKVLRITAAVIGVLLIAGAFLSAFYLTPNFLAILPDNVNVSRPLAGTFRTLLDPQAVAQGNLAAALKQNVPLTVDRHVKVLQVSGNTALVSDARTTRAAGTQVEQTTWQYAVDRRTLEATAHHPGSWQVVNATGLTIGWPPGAKRQTYTGWVPETTSTTPVAYTRDEHRNGLLTYVFQANVPPTRITDSQVLAGLPQALPKNLVALVAQLGPLTPAARQQLTALLPGLPDPVPLSYTLQEADTFWVEPETGVVIDVNRADQQRVVGVTSPGGTFIPLLPVYDATYRQTPEAVAGAVNDANNARTGLLWAGTIAPIIAGIIGALLLLWAWLAPRLRRSKPRPGSTP